MHGDIRGRRVAVVPDAVVNPPSKGPDPLSALAEQGWGVIALCPPGLEPSAHAAWLGAVVDEVVTFLDDEYEVALFPGQDSGTQEFLTALRATGRTVTHVLDLPSPSR